MAGSVRRHRQDAKKALDLVANCKTAYEIAPDQVRRQFNQVFFTKILVDVHGVTGTELTEEIGAILAADAAKTLEETALAGIFSGVGCDKDLLVDQRGVEPLTSPVRAVRARITKTFVNSH